MKEDVREVGAPRVSERRGALEGLARAPDEVASTLDGLERWADGLRNYWDASR